MNDDVLIPSRAIPSLANSLSVAADMIEDRLHEVALRAASPQNHPGGTAYFTQDMAELAHAARALRQLQQRLGRLDDGITIRTGIPK